MRQLYFRGNFRVLSNSTDSKLMGNKNFVETNVFLSDGVKVHQAILSNFEVALNKSSE